MNEIDSSAELAAEIAIPPARRAADKVSPNTRSNPKPNPDPSPDPDPDPNPNPHPHPHPHPHPDHNPNQVRHLDGRAALTLLPIAYYLLLTCRRATWTGNSNRDPNNPNPNLPPTLTRRSSNFSILRYLPPQVHGVPTGAGNVNQWCPVLMAMLPGEPVAH